MHRFVVALCGLLGCGRLGFAPEDDGRGDARAIDAAAPPAACWDGAIVASEPANAVYGSTMATDGQDLYVMWASAYDLLPSGTLWFRRFTGAGEPMQAATSLEPGDLGLNAAASPSLLFRGGTLLAAYSGHTGNVNSGGQLRLIELDATGSPLGPSTHISDNFAAPSPGVTTGGDNTLTLMADGQSLAVSVHGKYPWGGAGAWLRGAYVVNAETLQREGEFMCHVCYADHPDRAGNSSAAGATFYEPADDAFAMVAAAHETGTWVTRMRWIDRNNVMLGEVELDRHASLLAERPALAAAWDADAGRYVVLHGRQAAGTSALMLSTVDGGVAAVVTELTNSEQRFGYARMLRRADGGYWWLAATPDVVYVGELTPGLVPVGEPRALAVAEADFALLEHAGRLIVASRDAAATELRLRCFSAE